MAIKTTTGHAQYKLSLHLITSPYTAETIDAFGKIGGHVWMTQVFFSIQMGLALRVPNIANTHSCRYFLQLTIIIYFTGQAIQGVICQNQFYDIPS